MKRVCYGVFFSTDKDECALNPSICGFGQCKNTVGRFECSCKTGFTYDKDKKTCVGK